MPQHLFSRTAMAAALAALALTTTVTTAGAASPEDHPIEVSVDAAGITAPDSHPGGLVSFRVKTSDPNGRRLQLLRPGAGVTIERVLHDLADSVSSTRDTAAAGMKAVRGEAEALGGALVTPQVHEQFTEEAATGAVYLVDLTALAADPAHPVAKRLDLVGTGGPAVNQTRYPDGMVIQRDTPTGPGFQTENLDHAHLAYLVHNESGQLREMQLRPVGADTTDEQVHNYLLAVAAGLTAKSPFTGPPTGLGALSPDHSAAVQAHGLQPGRYALLSLLPDEGTGLPQAVLGMHKIVTLQ